jgi:hypothetical protein
MSRSGVGGWRPSDPGGGPKQGKPWGKGAAWGQAPPWGGGKRRPSWGGKYAAPWSRSAEIYGETVTVVIDRRTAENVYYALAIALGGVDWSESADYWGRKSRKGKGKRPADDGWSSKPWAADPWAAAAWAGGGPKGGGKGRKPQGGGPTPGPVTTPGPGRIPKTVTAVPVKAAVVKPVALTVTAVRPTSVKAVAVKPTTVKPTTVKPTGVAPTTVKPTAVTPTTVKPTVIKPTAIKLTSKARPNKKGASAKTSKRGAKKRRR